MNKVALKIAASPLVLGLAMTGCATDQSSSLGPAAASPQFARADQRAAESYELAKLSLQNGDNAAALVHAERAVELSPRDAGYRMLLGDLYLKSGRFISAEAAFKDVLTLNPGNNRATFNLILAEIALGKQHSAMMKLDRLAETAPAGDVGLAYALAGDPERAVNMLESAARAPGATGRVRQNLALAYALAGDWQRAKVTASQDLSPADVAGRMEQWASFVKPAAQWDQVASLLGVTPSIDAGQPVRLALAPAAPEAPVYAQAQVQPAMQAPAVQAPVEQPVQYAAAAIPAPVQQVHYEAPVQADVAPQPQVKAASAPRALPVKKLAQEVRTNGNGRFVVQLGSYNSAGALQQGWSQLDKRFALARYPALSAIVDLPGKGRFHRLSVAGFQTQSDAARVCSSIKAKGGACFVRAIAGDAPVRWASRDTRKG